MPGDEDDEMVITNEAVSKADGASESKSVELSHREDQNGLNAGGGKASRDDAGKDDDER